MYFELGQKNFKVSITSADVNYIQVQVQSRFKCDDLVSQVSTQQWSLSIVSVDALYHSTINPQVELNCT